MTPDGNSAGLYELMDLYVDGDKRAFDELHARLSPRLRGFLIKLVRDEATVDDLLQLTFIKAHLARERFEQQRGDPNSSVLAWYFAIARNVGLDHLRKRARQLKRSAGEGDQARIDALADGGPTVAEAAAETERDQAIVRRVRDAIAQLPDSQREVVELHKLRGMSMAEVAERLSIREGAARVRAHRGYKALARLLGSAGMIAWLPYAMALFTTTRGGQP